MRNDLITVLDVGTTKICCFVARKNADSRSGARVVGIGHHAANGLRGGVIVDMDVAAEPIASAVHTAEKMAEETIRSVIVNISGGQPLSQNFSVETDIAGHEVRRTEAVIRRQW